MATISVLDPLVVSLVFFKVSDKWPKGGGEGVLKARAGRMVMRDAAFLRRSIRPNKSYRVDEG